MKKKNLKILYDKESEVLSFELASKKSVDSDIQGNVVVDYDKAGKIVRINLYDFSMDAFRDNRKSVRDFVQQANIPLVVS